MAVEKIRLQALARLVGRLAWQVRQQWGSGKPTCAYLDGLCWALHQRHLPFRRGLMVQTHQLPIRERVDLVIADRLLVEIKALRLVTPFQRRQMRHLMRCGGWLQGMLVNTWTDDEGAFLTRFQ